MLTVQHLSILHNQDLRPLIQDLSFTLTGTERLAVIGEEGNGKSALLKAIAAPESLQGWADVSGEIHITHEKIGYLRQEVSPDWEALPVYQICAESAAFLDTDSGALAAICRSLDMPADLCWADTAFRNLSGGEKVRIRMLLLLCEKPTMLLLDEPGNDLDLSALQALERYLLTCNLPVLYVSHDETMLSRTATQVLHLESLHGRMEPRWTWAKEPYSEYVQTRRSQLNRQRNLWEMEQRDRRIRDEKLRKIEDAVAHAQATISRGDPHGGRLLKKKMKAVKSMEHRFEREDENAIEKPAEEYAMFAKFTEISPIPAGKIILDLHLPGLEAGERKLCDKIELQIRGPEKLLLIGENGTGKTTLLRIMGKQMAEKTNLKIAYMPQRYEDELDFEQTPVAYLNTDGSKEQMTFIRTALISMKFSREELEHPISFLSGGQKAKVLLLRLIVSQPDVLLLDEPTRNLSPLSAPVMRNIIRSFPSAVICVTHDRKMIEEWPGRILRLTSKGLENVPC
ncbi:MAG: ABC-F family ATP-binding cassette domain-containing protein [Clostridia bacterium]|nr:ABC-F family ATP-binding cassette domain-containing protein [Clostridia bacterium]